MLHDEHRVRYSDTLQSTRGDPDHLQPVEYLRARAEQRIIADDFAGSWRAAEGRQRDSVAFCFPAHQSAQSAADDFDRVLIAFA